MPVYVLREGETNHFKIGRTAGSLDAVHRRLRTGNPRPLNLFALIQTSDESACEVFFHRLLAHRRINLGGGAEFFEAEPNSMCAIAERLREIFNNVQQGRDAVRELSQRVARADELTPTASDTSDLNRLRVLQARRNALQIEIEMLGLKLKQRIGNSSGIRSVASWKTQIRRCYDEDLFRLRDPNLYETVLERFHCIDTSSWKRADETLYKQVQTTYFRPTSSRIFKLCPGSSDSGD